MTSKAVAKRPIDVLKAIIHSDSVQEQFKNAMGKHSDLFVASLIDVFNSGLQDCDPAGVVQEALKAAVLKLPISKGLGFAYLVPYKEKGKPVAQFQIGYKGMIQLAMRSGQLAALNGGPVFEGEFKAYDRLTGVVDISGEQTSEKVTGYFVYMELINGFKKSEYWTTEKVIAHAKAKSKSFSNSKSAWVTDFPAMATKTVLRSMLGKYAPMSIDFIAALQTEETPTEPVDITPETEPEPEKKPPAGKKEKAETKKTEPKKTEPEKDKDGNEVVDVESEDVSGDPGADEPY
jgi:recombination protein RecT